MSDIVELKPGERLRAPVRLDRAWRRARRCRSRWPGLADAVDPDDVIYLADGAIRLRVGRRARRRGEVETAVEVGGSVASRQGLNIPGSTRGLQAVPEEDLDMLRFGESIGVDLVALSFVRTAEDVETVRRHTRLPLIAKIEKPQAVDDAEDDHPRRRLRDGRARRPRDRAADRGRPDRPEAAAAHRRPARAPVDHRHPDARLDGQLARGRRAPRRPTSPTRSSTAPTR